jgi:hypothetical protein
MSSSMSDADGPWRVVIADVAAMRRWPAIWVLGSTELTYVDAFQVVSNGPGSFRSGPMTRRHAERVARSAQRHGAEARVEPFAPKAGA